MLGNSNKYNQGCGRVENLSAFDAFVQANNGSGSGSGYGSGDGDGYGDGYGSGDGYGDGDGYGYGDGSGIKMFAGNQVYLIDRTPTLLYIVHGNIAKGAILKADLTTEPCYVITNGDLFAHGETLHEAQSALIEKQFEDMDDDDRINAFLAEIDINKQYPTSVFFEWHHRLTGSCEMGRRVFAENHGIDLENGTMTVGEFVELTKNAYGGRIIKKIEERIKIGDK